jgi:hypothetical protein
MGRLEYHVGGTKEYVYRPTGWIRWQSHRVTWPVDWVGWREKPCRQVVPSGVSRALASQLSNLALQGSTLCFRSGGTDKCPQLLNLAHPMPVVQPHFPFWLNRKSANQEVYINCIGSSDYVGQMNSSTRYKDDCIFRSGNPGKVWWRVNFRSLADRVRQPEIAVRVGVCSASTNP